MDEPLSVRALGHDEAAEWQAWLGTSGNGTLFHDLEFLAYHPPGRFRFHHLVVRKGHRIVSLVPGGLIDADEGLIWRSPVGASIGGPVLAPRARVTEALAVVGAVQDYARGQNWQRVEMTLPPGLYHRDVGDLPGFALFRGGFREQHRWLCPTIDLDRIESGAPVESLFEKRQMQSLRGALRKGAMAIEAGVDALDDFAPVFEDTYARHGTAPTHTLGEIEDLMRRLPDRVRLVLARQDQHVTAGLLVMLVTPAVATTFYICSGNEHSQASGSLVAIRALLEALRQRGCRWLDLGPSASDTALNAGVMFFKEGLGAVGYSRSQWSWNIQG